ncbi:MAG: HD domain-containing protein, partial [Flavobacteriia bacterium]|nr:HD domain-containing protein [Flavobacteriia bacterium]
DKVFPNNQGNSELLRLKETVRLACLLHDIGHAPLSHTTEFVMPHVSELNLPSNFITHNGQATHEDYTIKSIVDSSFSEAFKNVIDKFGINIDCVAELILGVNNNPDYFTYKGINYFPLLQQLVSSEMDCDRMDYLLRDSYFCGVSYGKFDLDWIIDNLRSSIIDSKAYLGISERAIATFDDFLLCRFHMFLMVYFHYKSVALEKMLKRYFTTAPEEYSIPADIEKYLDHDDHFLMKVLRNSDNYWAKRIIRNNIPMKIFETFGHSQEEQLLSLENYLTQNNIDYIKCSSQGRLSKYYTQDKTETKLPMKVIRESSILENHVNIKNINEATDLYEKFSKSHTVNRIHCDFMDLSQGQKADIIKLVKS